MRYLTSLAVIVFFCLATASARAEISFKLPVLGVLSEVKVLDGQLSCTYDVGGVVKEMKIGGIAKCPSTFSF